MQFLRGFYNLPPVRKTKKRLCRPQKVGKSIAIFCIIWYDERNSQGETPIIQNKGLPKYNHKGDDTHQKKHSCG